MNTKWHPKTLSVDIKRLRQVKWLEIGALIGLGLVIALVQANQNNSQFAIRNSQLIIKLN